MPRRRTSNRPVRRRIKLDTSMDVTSEMGRVYRSAQYGDIARSDATKDIFMLSKLRDGVADQPAVISTGNLTFNVILIPSGHVLTKSGIKALASTTPLSEITLDGFIEPLFPNEQPPLAPTAEAQDEKVTPLRPSEAMAIESDIMNDNDATDLALS